MIGPLEREITEMLLPGVRAMAEHGCWHPVADGDCLEVGREPLCPACISWREVRRMEKNLAETDGQ